MIKTFKNNNVRNSGVIYNSTFEQIKKLYGRDPQTAGELAISAIELVLTGDMSTDDNMIDILLEPLKTQRNKDKIKYDTAIEIQRQAKIASQRLDVIAEMVNAGEKQSVIAKRLGLTQQTVSNRVRLIRTEFPELLQTKDVCKSKNQLVQTKNACTNLYKEKDACTNEEELVQACTNFVQDDTSCTNKNQLVQLVENEKLVKETNYAEIPLEKVGFYF